MRMHPSLEGHRIHLRALAHREQVAAYQRHDYLSREWQLGLWRGEVKGTRQPDDTTPLLSPSLSLSPSPSPSSVTSVTVLADGGGATLTPSEISVGWRERISEWKYSVTVLDDGGGATAPLGPSAINMGWRERIIEWKYQVVDRFELDREIVGISTYYLDQYLSMHYVDSEVFQLVSMTCIHLAIKLHSPKKMSMQLIVSMGNGLVTTQHMEATELSIMKCLKWHLFPPTAMAFLRNLFPLLALPSDDAAKALDFARYLVELSVCAYPLASVRPSSVALAAVRYSLEVCGCGTDVKGGRTTAAALQGMVHGPAAPDGARLEAEACGRILRRLHRLALLDEDTG